MTSSNVLSNPEDISLPLRWIALMSGKISCDLAASTGVHDSTGLIKQILAGANAVQVVSALYKHGTGHVGKILDGLETWMIGKGYHSLQDFMGKMSADNIKNPAAYERVQFMRYFRSFEG